MRFSPPSPPFWCYDGVMASLTLKDIPDQMLDRLRRRARADRRSLSQEALYLLERSLDAEKPTLDAKQEAAAQIKQWRALAKRWKHAGSHADLIEQIYAARTAGRPVEL